MFELLADNTLLRALSNVAGILALGILIWKSFLNLKEFLNIAYRTNIKSAIQRIRRTAIIEARVCAVDIHMFVARLVSHSIMILLLVGLTAMLSAGFSPATEAEFELKDSLIFTDYQSYLPIAKIARDATGFFSIVPWFLASLRVLQLAHLLYLVQRFRARWYLKKMLTSPFLNFRDDP